MSEFDIYKKNEYLPYLKDINNLLLPDVQKILVNILPSESIIILNLIINNFQTKMNTPPKKNKRFYEHILFPVGYVKEQTGLERQAQQRAIKLLDRLSLIEYDYHNQTRCIYLLPKNFKHFYKQFILKYIKITSQQNWNMFQLIELYHKYLEYIEFLD